ncbi:hypothetical protein HOP62_05895 [Halomonas sp. MCCC 1A17488]|uniref:Outer membrane protein beta-barrel domain-containing protein n=1 Tax=Billgrantia sulfidoxydans TaxID=2733484 RepID=A0ABX7W4H1_9GAMM|nr:MULTISPECIES: hypothetical protein [Halomonas]MCE8015610.1 hypothetical protein [Halomonas sp. MCCC 1A17488]MCG3238943.1 hypothetical protein [Halomonas sp. MCCC 1A17488]QPP51104.1 hypothetical protein I4484_08500 [Halomonas sp. SS10-MC5]QTP54615.1 hypothetical protein HNO51_07910 [Halomonas sulfidoxydans]
MSTCFRGAITVAAGLTLLPLVAMADAGLPQGERAPPYSEQAAYAEASRDLLASLTFSPLNRPSYASRTSDLMYLDNGVVLEGGDLETLDGHTSGFRVTAGFSPADLPHLDLGAEFTYRESDEVPTRYADQAMLVNTTTLGGSLVAGVRMGRFGLYAKSGFAEWEGDPVTQGEPLYAAANGTARIQGFGARLQHNRLVSRLEFEEIDAPSMAHLNLITASLHYAF